MHVTIKEVGSLTTFFLNCQISDKWIMSGRCNSRHQVIELHLIDQCTYLHPSDVDIKIVAVCVYFVFFNIRFGGGDSYWVTLNIVPVAFYSQESNKQIRYNRNWDTLKLFFFIDSYAAYKTLPCKYE